jgi:hypothetical protein
MASTPYQTAVSGANPDVWPITIPVYAASAIANADELTTYTPGFNFEVVKIDWVTVTAITTGAKTATINPKIGSTVIPGTATALAGAQAKGAVVNVWTQSATTKTYGKATDTLSLTASAVTAFAEGAGYFLIQLHNVGNLA